MKILYNIFAPILLIFVGWKDVKAIDNRSKTYYN